MSPRTVVIGFSGVSLPLDDMPFVREWSASGVRAGLAFPAAISDIGAWTSMVTGQSPAHHGIFDLFRRQSPGSMQLRVLGFRDLTGEAIWTSLDGQGLKTTLLNYPLTFPAPKIEGHVLPGSWVPAKRLKLGCHPSGLFRELSVIDGVDLGELTAESLFRVLHYLMEKEPSDFILTLVRDTGGLDFANIDRHLERVVQAAGANATVLLLSSPSNGKGLALNGWLAEHGYLASSSEISQGTILETADLQREAASIDWAKTRAWCPPGGGNGVFIVRQDSEHPTGVPDGEYDAFRSQLKGQLQSAPGIARVWKQEELCAGPFQDLTPDLIVELAGNTEGRLLAKGPALKHGIELANLPLSAITPLLYYTLELGRPSQIEGFVPTEVLDPVWVGSHPLTGGSSNQDLEAAKPLINPEDEEEILRSLRSLGYLE